MPCPARGAGALGTPPRSGPSRTSTRRPAARPGKRTERGMPGARGHWPLCSVHGNFPDSGKFPARGGSSPPSDTLNPHILRFPGMADRRPGAGSRQRRGDRRFYCLLLLGVRPFGPWSACLQGDGLCSVSVACAQGSGCRIVGEGDLLLPQGAEHLLSALRVDVGSAPGAAPPWSAFGLGEQQVQGGQVRHDQGLAEVGVLRAFRARRAGGGVAVAAPVGGVAVGPGRFQPPAAGPAYQQPGQQVAGAWSARRVRPGATGRGRR